MLHTRWQTQTGTFPSLLLERHAQTSHYNVLIQVTACEQAVAKMKSDIHCKSKMRSEELSRWGFFLFPLLPYFFYQLPPYFSSSPFSPPSFTSLFRLFIYPTSFTSLFLLFPLLPYFLYLLIFPLYFSSYLNTFLSFLFVFPLCFASLVFLFPFPFSFSFLFFFFTFLLYFPSPFSLFIFPPRGLNAAHDPK